MNTPQNQRPKGLGQVAFRGRFRFGALLALVAGASLGFAQEWKPDADSLTKAGTELSQYIRAALEKRGVQVQNERVDLAFSFCTSSYPVDPVSASAARGIASRVVENFSSKGDKIYGLAYDLGVWNHRPGLSSSVEIVSQSNAELDQIRALWPLAAQTGSGDGHDTEKAIVDSAALVTNKGRTIMIFLANYANTMVPQGYTATGGSAPDYLAVLSEWTRLPAVNKSGASFELPYIAEGPGSRKSRALDCIVLIPTQFQSEALAAGKRDHIWAEIKPPAPEPSPTPPTLAPPTPAATDPSPPPDQSGLIGVLILVFLAIVGGVAYYLSIAFKPGFMHIAEPGSPGRGFSLKAAKPGALLCRLVGKGFPGAGDSDVCLAAGPPKVVAEVYRTTKGIEISPEGLVLARADGQEVGLSSARYPLSKLKEIEVIFSGTEPRAGLPAIAHEVRVNFTLSAIPK